MKNIALKGLFENITKTKNAKSIASKLLFGNITKTTKRPAVASIPELAVVLIILGLLLTSFGIFSKIIGIAKTNSIITYFTTIKEGTYSFKITYQFLPGDMPNGSSLLDSSQQNGNGDGFVSWGQATGTTTGNESLVFFQHSKATGLYNDLAKTTITPSINLVPGVSPKSNIDNATVVPVSLGTASLPAYGTDSTGKQNTFTLIFGNISATGTAISATTTLAGTGITSATGKNFDTGAVDSTILLSIDKKIDDNSPTTGNFKYDSTQALPIAGLFVEAN